MKRRSPTLPKRDLCLTVARQFGELPAIHMGSGHRARRALADPLLLGDVVLNPDLHALASVLNDWREPILLIIDPVDSRL